VDPRPEIGHLGSVPHLRVASLSAAFLLLGAASAHADPPAEFALATGEYGMRREIPHSVGVEMELRMPWRWGVVRPVTGLLTTTGGLAYLYSGIALEIPIAGSWRVTPAFAPGLLLARGDGDLGSPIEFRSSLELSVAPEEKLRLGLGFSHISNARLGTSNPGVEVLTFRVAFGATK
jgi:lipid A 3-O-deacylase